MTFGKPDPYLSVRFRVRLRLNEIEIAGFSEVTGLETSMEPLEYQEGGANGFAHRLPSRMTHSSVTLKRGMTDSHELWGWLADVRTLNDPQAEVPTVRRDVQVYLQNGLGVDVRGWELREAFPVRWGGPELKADQGAVAIETLELTHHGLKEMSLPEGRERAMADLSRAGRR